MDEVLLELAKDTAKDMSVENDVFVFGKSELSTFVNRIKSGMIHDSKYWTDSRRPNTTAEIAVYNSGYSQGALDVASVIKNWGVYGE